MYTWINKRSVKCSTGYSLVSMHRLFYHYVEGDRIMRIFIEGCLDDSIYNEKIDLASFKHWLPPYDKALVAPGKQEEIKRNVSNALTFMGIEHHFVDTPA